jgi:hypothetical protein
LARQLDALTTLIVIPAGAHLFEFPAKIRMTEADYFTVQSIYAGWGLFAVAILASITANGYLSWRLRAADRPAARWALTSALLICLTLVIFFIVSVTSAPRPQAIDAFAWVSAAGRALVRA